MTKLYDGPTDTMKLIPNVIKLLFNNDYSGFNRL